MRRIFLLLSLLAYTQSHAQEPVYSRVKVHTDDAAHDLRHLGALGIAVDHGQAGSDFFLTELSAAEIERAQVAGFTCEVLVDDMTAFYQARNAAGPQPGERALGWLCDGARPFDMPAHFHLGSMGGFFTWQELLDELDSMAAAYPDLITPRTSIGTSIEGRTIDFMRISNDPDTDQDKPEVLYDALHHAREPESIMQLVFFMWHMLENYGTDAEVTYLLDTRELYFVPCVNPDGYVYNQTIEPLGGGMWRKNRRDNGDGTFGVDLNRNYGWNWGLDDVGSSPNTNSDVYRGTAPFSEPETQALRDFCIAHSFRAVLNYHTYHNLLIHPWGAEANALTPDSMLFEEQARLLTRNNSFGHGTTNQTLFYLTNGGSDDWMYGEQVDKPKIMSMTPEVGRFDDGFWPESWRIVPLSKQTMDANLMQAHLVGAYAKALDRSLPVLSSTAPYIPFDLQRLGLDTGTYAVSIEPLENVISGGGPIIFSGMDTLEVRSDSIQIFLQPGLADGDAVRFILAVSTGGVTYRDTVIRVFGTPEIALADAGNDMGNWQAMGWGTTTEDYYSPPSCITDSPFGNYAPFQGVELTLDDPIDLGNVLSATLTFMCRWDVLRSIDQVQISASTDDFNTSTPLCGIYTHGGGESQSIDEPIYDGQQYTWVKEEMSLDDFIGQTIKLRFFLNSQSGETHDGFYFDDLAVTTTTSSGVSVTEPLMGAPTLSNQPNPAMGSTVIHYQLPEVPAGSRIVIYDAPGALVREVPVASATGSVSIDTEGLGSGVYLYSIAADQLLAPLQRMLVIAQ